MSTADAGGTCPGASCTLRQAIATAASGDTINFSLPANSTINLTSGQLIISKNLTINGPGPNLLTVQRSAAGGTPQFRIFNTNFAGINVTIFGLTIANGNPAHSDGNGNGDGGGIYNQNATLAITNCIISGNSVFNNTAFGGGGIVNFGGTVTITNSTVSGNLVTSDPNGGGQGGAGIFSEGGTVTIINSTFSGNAASIDLDGFGGAIGSESATVTITNSTITDNAGGGIDNVAGTVRARNTIIAKNTSTQGPDVSGSLTSQGFNLIGNRSGATITPTTGDQIGTAAAPLNPMLGPLQDNGGPTFTHALLSGSSAIDAGNSSGSGIDQRGFARPVDDPGIANASGGDGSDIGAYEVQADQLPGCISINHIVNNNNDSGTDSLRGVIANVCVGSTIAFAPNVTGAINLTSGELALNMASTSPFPA
jgi:hypothetical protein